MSYVEDRIVRYVSGWRISRDWPEKRVVAWIMTSDLGPTVHAELTHKGLVCTASHAGERWEAKPPSEVRDAMEVLLRARVTFGRDLAREILCIRSMLDTAWSADTRAPGWPDSPPSAGHCAAVALALCWILDAQIVSALIDDASHWFCRKDGLDFDLTGDQFGGPKVQIVEAGSLYPGTRERAPHEALADTVRRAKLLAVRAGWLDAEIPGGPDEATS